jgi:hypothetical protein
MVSELNPFLELTEGACEKVRIASITWLELCVLEDKLERVKDICDSIALGGESAEGLESEIVRELLTVRDWEPEKHPKWLAFEVDAGLQIRPAQYGVAKALFEDIKDSSRRHGAILQLNMG